MKVEQTGVNEIKVTLDTDVEKATIGKADQIKLTIEQTAAVGFRTTLEIPAKRLLLDREDDDAK